jgi:sulfatase modifying factor 1
LFAKVLRSYQTGGITYSDFLGHVNRYLAAGESSAELLEVLRRRQLIEPLPDFAHDALARLLNQPSLAATEDTAAAAESSSTSDPTTAVPPALEPDKTVAIVRADTTLHPYSAPHGAASSLQQVPALRPAPSQRTIAPLEKTVAIPRAGMSINDEGKRPRATPSLKPIVPHPPLHTPPPAPTAPPAPPPAAAATHEPISLSAKTVAMPRAGMTIGDYQPPSELDILDPGAPTPPTQRTPPGPRRMRGIWVSAAVIAVALIIGWIYTRPSPTPAATPSASNVVSGQLPAEAPAMSTVPPDSSAEPGTIIQDCPTCPRMIVLPAGRFKQGSAYDDHDAQSAEKPQHIVLIRRPLAMAATELTVENFRVFAADSGREMQGCDTYDGEWHLKATADWQDPGFAQTADHPVACVSWNDAVAYATWLSAKTGHHYRLPSASEWEYAARAGSDAQLPWSPGLQAACENANVADRSAARRYPKWSVFACKDGFVNTAPVGSFKANAFGISDMLGNVFEWTADCWHDDYSKAPIDGSARMDGDCTEHELRGGSWFSSPAFVRLPYRGHFATGLRSSSIGVRLVRELNS